jgi:hypothetical protein
MHPQQIALSSEFKSVPHDNLAIVRLPSPVVALTATRRGNHNKGPLRSYRSHFCETT